MADSDSPHGLPSLETVAEKWETMFNHIAHDLGCIAKVTRGPGGWGCEIMDPLFPEVIGVTGRTGYAEAIRAGVDAWQKRRDGIT